MPSGETDPSAMTDLPDDETPLDPATERLRRKMLRLLAVAVATMLLGVMAVLAAIVYKVNQDAAAPRPAGTPIAIALPAGTRIEAVAIDGDEALLTLAGAGEDRMVRVDLRTGAILARYRFPAP